MAAFEAVLCDGWLWNAKSLAQNEHDMTARVPDRWDLLHAVRERLDAAPLGRDEEVMAFACHFAHYEMAWYAHRNGGAAPNASDEANIAKWLTVTYGLGPSRARALNAAVLPDVTAAVEFILQMSVSGLARAIAGGHFIAARWLARRGEQSGTGKEYLRLNDAQFDFALLVGPRGNLQWRCVAEHMPICWLVGQAHEKLEHRPYLTVFEQARDRGAFVVAAQLELAAELLPGLSAAPPSLTRLCAFALFGLERDAAWHRVSAAPLDRAAVAGWLCEARNVAPSRARQLVADAADICATVLRAMHYDFLGRDTLSPAAVARLMANAMRKGSTQGAAYALLWLQSQYDLSAADMCDGGRCHVLIAACEQDYGDAIAWTADTFELTAEDARADGNAALRAAQTQLAGETLVAKFGLTSADGEAAWADASPNKRQWLQEVFALDCEGRAPRGKFTKAAKMLH